MENNYEPPIWSGNVIDEEELSPEERARLPWNDPDDFLPRERHYHLEESPCGLMIEVEEDWDDEEQERPSYTEEKPDINLIYGLYEESEFY